MPLLRSKRAEDAAARGDANTASLLTWFLPGLGHLYLGHAAHAVVAFAVVEGLYALGLYLTDGLTFSYLDPELRGPFATALTPEVGNLGALIYQVRSQGFVDPMAPVPWPRFMTLGAILTGVSGMLNVCLMVHAHVMAKVPAEKRTRASGRRLSPALVVLLGWLLPGLGHLVLGRRLRGVVILVLLLGLFVLGTAFAEMSNLSRERHFYYWSGQFLLGLPAIVGELAGGGLRVTHDIRLADVGLLFGCVAGLLNVLAMLDAYGIAEGRMIEPSPAPTGGGAVAAEPR